ASTATASLSQVASSRGIVHDAGIEIPVPSEYTVLLDAVAPARFARARPSELAADEWQRTLEAAAWHRVTPLLHRHLAASGGAPVEVLEATEAAYSANAARNLYIGEALRVLLEALDSGGVRVALLKGAALVDSVYSDPAIREMLDLDLLVGEADLE